MQLLPAASQPTLSLPCLCTPRRPPQYSSGKGAVKYPFRGMDVCSWATYALYLEGTSYAYDKPGTSRDPGVPVGHFVNSECRWL